MNSDIAIVQGKSHTICQDYARSGPFYALVADGCSGSADSDFGARLLVKLAEKHILAGYCGPDLPVRVIEEARVIQEQLGLENTALDATLLAIIAGETEVTVFCAGDGMLLFEYLDETTEIYDIDYSKGYPFYINYLLDTGRLEHFLNINPEPEIKCITYGPHESTEQKLSEKEVDKHYRFFTIPQGFLKKAVLFSDGIKSFRQKRADSTGCRDEKVAYEEIIFEMTGFKNAKGRFVQRRINKFMKECARQEIANYDDVSVASLVFR